MTLNLVRDAWIPIRRTDGEVDRIAPWQVTEKREEGRIIALASPRADFDGALAQFLIGLLQTFAAPDDPRDWRRWMDQPPEPGELRSRLEPAVAAFELLAERGPRFLQDLELPEEPPFESVERLLIDHSSREGRDHFVKSGTIERLCEPCAASALITLQINAPTGGRGYRTGLRGGGPLTTLVVDPSGLWPTLWLNVLEADRLPRPDAALRAPADRFPWLAPTRTSARGETTTLADVDPLQMYWAMPRRIRLIADSGPSTEACSLCEETPDPMVTAFATTNYGVNYVGAWSHPLSPHRDNKGEPLPLKGDAGALSYRRWLGWVQESEDGSVVPAQVVRHVREVPARHRRAADYKLWAFGFDMDNMKARAWLDGTLPLILVRPELLARFDDLARRLVLAADFAARAAARAVGDATKRPVDVTRAFWSSTERPFFHALDRGRTAEDDGGDTVDIRRQWWKDVRGRAIELFDSSVAGDDFQVSDPGDIAKAWRRLNRDLHSPKLKQEILELPKEET